MSPEQFRKIDINKKAEIIWDGVHIGDRQDEEYNILLYKCNDDLYIEIYCHRVRNVIDKYLAFSKDELF